MRSQTVKISDCFIYLNKLSIDASLQNACTKREGTDYTAQNSLLISKHFGLISTSRSCLKNYQYFGKDSQNKRLEMIET